MEVFPCCVHCYVLSTSKNAWQRVDTQIFVDYMKDVHYMSYMKDPEHLLPVTRHTGGLWAKDIFC